MLPWIALLPMLLPPPAMPARADPVDERVCIAAQTSPLATVQLAVSFVDGKQQPGYRHAWSAGPRGISLQADWTGDGVSGLPDTAEVTIILDKMPRRYRGWARLELWNDAAPGVREQGRVMSLRNTRPPHVMIEIPAGRLRSLAQGGAVTVAAVGDGNVVLWRGSILADTLDEPSRLAARARPDLDADIAEWSTRCRIVSPPGEIVVT